MTIMEAIERTDSQKPNQYETEDKLHWLSQLDHMAFRDIISTHEDGPDSFAGYSVATSVDTQLLIPDEFSDVYIKWLCAQIDFANQEISRYTNSMIMFNALYTDFGNAYNRTHMPKAVYIKGAGGKVIR